MSEQLSKKIGIVTQNPDTRTLIERNLRQLFTERSEGVSVMSLRPDDEKHISDMDAVIIDIAVALPSSDLSTLTLQHPLAFYFATGAIHHEKKLWQSFADLGRASFSAGRCFT